MDEFDFIGKYLAPLAGPEGLGLLDDAALYAPRAGYDLVLTKDTMIEGVHFPMGVFDERVAGKLLRTNLSDLAAKGAKPIGYLLSLALPGGGMQPDILRSMAGGLEDVQAKYDFKLFGGDTVSGAKLWTMSATFIGEVPSGRMVTRSGAQAGDDIWVSGTIGDAAIPVMMMVDEKAGRSPAAKDVKFWEGRYWSPEPRLEIGEILRSFATASVDVSDGLLADAGHIAKASGVNLQIKASDIPLSESTKDWADKGTWKDDIIDLAAGGDDYEILFMAPKSAAEKIKNAIRETGTALTKIGTCGSGQGVDLLGKSGGVMILSKRGYSHF